MDLYGTGKQTTVDGATLASPKTASPRAADTARSETPEQRIARLEAENTQPGAEKTKLSTERDVLRQAAKYFAGETRW